VPDPTRAAVELLPADALLAATSVGLLKIPHLAAFFGGRRIVAHAKRLDAAAYIGWGLKRSGFEARRHGIMTQRPVAILEDGFIRSVGLGKSGAPPVSLVVDDTGIYFDASVPSRLERLLADVASWLTPDMLRAATSGLERWQTDRLSKYNLGHECTFPAAASSRIILVDQVAGDASIGGAFATYTTFSAMLATALAHFPAQRLAVRIHPDVAAGRARGHLAAQAQAAGVAILSDDLTPHAVLAQAEAVWTVSSGLGFDALLRGVPVTTFGVPFYAGYGLTDDRIKRPEARAALTRRGQIRSREEMFAAAFLAYARYADPVTQRPLNFDGACDRLVDWRRRTGALSAGRTYAFGFSRWKRLRASTFLGAPAAVVTFGGRPTLRALRRAKATDAQRIAVWGVTDPAGFESAVRASGRSFVRVEDGFIRSVGLGSDIRPAGSLVLDDLGIYYDASRENRLERLIAEGPFDATLLRRAAALRRRLIEQELTKYNLQSVAPQALPDAHGRSRVLVVEQVPGDAALRLGTADITTNAALLATVRAARPDAFVIYKEHPDVVSGNRKGRLAPAVIRAHADHIVSDGDLARLYAVVDEVHVMSSLAGFEALCRGRCVVVWGRPFYGGWGLTEDRASFAPRPRAATLDELVAATLILYPRYIDPVCGVPCSAEEFVGAIERLRAAGHVSPAIGGLWRQVLHHIGRLRRAVLPAH
jgi:capsular polysaccharide export protein